MPNVDPAAVRAFEHAGWQRAAAEYNQTFASASGQFVEPLLDAAGVGAGTRLLDLCCGTGLATAAAARRGALVTGIDFSPAMLEVARRSHPQLRFEEGDAEALSCRNASFDAVVANFGIHHIARPERAMAEARRVLRAGGSMALTSWAAPADNIAWRLLFDAVRACGDPDAAAGAPPSGGALASIDAVLQLLRHAGFSDCRAETVHRAWQVADPADLLSALERGTVRTAALIAAQPEKARSDIAKALAAAAAVYRRGAGFAVPIVAILGRGTKSPA